MDVVIPQNRSGAHAISKYQFKILSALNGSSIGEAVQEIHHMLPDEPVVDHTKGGGNSSKDEFIESLLKVAM